MKARVARIARLLLSSKSSAKARFEQDYSKIKARLTQDFGPCNLNFGQHPFSHNVAHAL